MLILNYILGRIAQSVPVVLGVTLLAFLTIQLVPGDPIRIMLHGRATDAVVEAARDKLGLNEPVPVQFVQFLGNALRGDLGTSIIQGAPVTDIIGERLGPSVFLLTYGTLIAVLLAVPLSIIAASNKDRPIDHVIRIGGMIGFAMPPFWIGLLLMLFFGLTLGLFPISGYGDGFLDNLSHMTLPSMTIAFFLAPILIQSMRSAMLDVMSADFIEVARSKGLSERRIMVKHVLRNALIPTITVLAINIGWMLSGAVIVEYVFSLPGLGSLLVRSVGFRDYPVIQGLTVVFSLFVVMVNLLADLAYILVDPRVQKG